MKVNRSALEKRRRHKANCLHWYAVAIPGRMDAHQWDWLLEQWRIGFGNGHGHIEIEEYAA